MIAADIEEMAEAMDEFVENRSSARLFSFPSAPGYHYRVAGIVFEERQGGEPTGQFAARVNGEWT